MSKPIVVFKWQDRDEGEELPPFPLPDKAAHAPRPGWNAGCSWAAQCSAGRNKRMTFKVVADMYRILSAGRKCAPEPTGSCVE